MLSWRFGRVPWRKKDMFLSFMRRSRPVVRNQLPPAVWAWSRDVREERFLRANTWQSGLPWRFGRGPVTQGCSVCCGHKNYKLHFKTNLLSVRFGRDPLRKKEGLIFGYLNTASFQRFKRYLPTNAQAFFLGDLGVSPVTHERIAFQDIYGQK